MQDKITLNYSPNFSISKRNKKKIKYIIYHYTGMKSETKAIKRLTSLNSNVSCHFFIKRNGDIIKMVPEVYTAWHAGISSWNNDESLNKYSIGIEISNKGHNFGYQKYLKKQIKSLINLSRYLIKKYNLKKKNIVGHSDVAFNRKKDPGEKFPWKKLSSKGIGIWHNIENKNLKKLRKKNIEKNNKKKFLIFLKKIGYMVKNSNNSNLNNLIKSFQRRFRPELINGKIDRECYIIAEKISKI